jgi:hypothetical protein
MKAYYNEFDEFLVVCADCEESINEGIDDDREFFIYSHKTTQTICGLCDLSETDRSIGDEP